MQEILSELRQIRALIQPRRCSSQDLAKLAQLLPAIGGRWGSTPVTTREILSDPAIRVLFPGSKGSLGSLLSRAAADTANVHGYCIGREAKEHGAALWVVSRLPEPVAKSSIFK